jgi:hypothetical protein
MNDRGDLNEQGLIFVNAELKRRGMDTVGLRNSLIDTCSRFASVKQCYEEINSNIILGGEKRSDITDERSMKLYASFFDGSTPLNEFDINYLNGCGSKVNGAPTSSFSLNDVKTKTFRSAAFTPLFLDSQVSTPSGFEQINEDLFARKDNRFLVFNGAGVESADWPPKSHTRILQTDDIRILS